MCHHLCHQGCPSATCPPCHQLAQPPTRPACHQATLGCLQASMRLRDRGCQRPTPDLQGSRLLISREYSHQLQCRVSKLISMTLSIVCGGVLEMLHVSIRIMVMVLVPFIVQHCASLPVVILHHVRRWKGWYRRWWRWWWWWGREQ